MVIGESSIGTATTNSSKTSGKNQWATRELRGFPQGTQVRQVELDTNSKAEYGEKTWTTGQTVRDILQNHLDANTQVYFDQLISRIVDLDNDDWLKKLDEDHILAESFDYFVYQLSRFLRSNSSLSVESRHEFQEKLIELARGLPISQEFRNSDHTLAFEQLLAAVEDVVDVPPEITYQIRNTENPNEVLWVSRTELTEPPYNLRKVTSDDFRFEIIACKISDHGSGFDSKLTAYYKSTKTGKQHLRGKFGEGAKMSELHLVRNHVFVKLRSAFAIESDSGPRLRMWQTRPHVDTNNHVVMKGVEIETELDESVQAGSITYINFRDAKTEFAQEFSKNIDPRDLDGLAANCLSYSPYYYEYPIGETNSLTVLGVNTHVSGEYQYVQGLRIETNSGSGSPIFSYDFLNSSVLKGRDRNQLELQFLTYIVNFWRQVDSPVLLAKLISEVWLEPKNFDSSSPEFKALQTIIVQATTSFSPQFAHTAQIVLEIIPNLLQLKENGKYIVIKSEMESMPMYKATFDVLKRNGYQLLTVATLDELSINKLNELYKGKYELLTAKQAQELASSFTAELGHEDERIQTLKSLYREVHRKLSGELTNFHFGSELLKVGDPIFLEVSSSYDQPVELEWVEQTAQFRLVIRPDLMFSEPGSAADAIKGFEATYWQQYIEVFLLATVDRSKPFLDQNSILQNAQAVAQTLLDKSIHEGQVDFDGLPDRFNHKNSGETADTAYERFSQHLEQETNELRAWQAYRESCDLNLSSERLGEIYASLDQYPKTYADKIRMILLKRVLVEGDTVSFIGRKENGSTITKSFDQLEVLGHWQGNTIVKIDADRYLVRLDFPDGSLIKQRENYELLFFDNQILEFGAAYFGTYQYMYRPFLLEKSGLIYSISNADNPVMNDLDNLTTKLNEITIRFPETAQTEELHDLEKEIDTSLPIEYGVEEWNNPIRIFQDIVQNHIDASPNRKGVQQFFEVQRSGKRIWVAEDEVADDDEIVGITMVDFGVGYTPNELGTMGNTSKVSPLFSGKYGEGQKLIATSAARNQFELTYSSVAYKNGQKFRWTAHVGTRSEELILGGKKAETNRIIFHQNAEPLEEDVTYTSSTTLQLPEAASEEQQQIWSNWVRVVDPRNKDEHGNGGLSRYAINLRNSYSPNTIDLGYMRILLDEPGAIYENGLLVNNGQPSFYGSTRFGYDVPKVTNTRERNGYSVSQLQLYLAHLITNCPDPRYANRIMYEIATTQLDRLQSGNTGLIESIDLSIGSIENLKRRFNFARPFWNRANRRYLGGVIVHSSDATVARIGALHQALAQNSQHIYSRETAINTLESLQRTQANLQHIPPEKLIDINGKHYESWSCIFPTAEQYVQNLIHDAIPTTTETQTALQNLVANASQYISEKLAKSLNVEADTHTLDYLLSETQPPNSLDLFDRNQNRISAYVKLRNWLDRQQLKDDPESVFVAPSYAGYLGIAEKNRIGFNEVLLTSGGQLHPDLVGTARHELIHKIFGLRDYTPEFILLLRMIT